MSNGQRIPRVLKKLNREQQEAATYGIRKGVAKQHRPLLIVAGAGTGKTETTAMRLGYLVSCGADPNRIIAVSFTQRASRELVERAQKAINDAKSGAKVQLPYAGTFHSVALRFLREFATEAG